MTDEKPNFWEGGQFDDIDHLEISLRTSNALRNAGATSFKRLRQIGPNKLKEIKGLGKRGYNDLMEAIYIYYSKGITLDSRGFCEPASFPCRLDLTEEEMNMTHPTPDERDWSKIAEPAKDAYWKARREGADETAALILALKVAIEAAKDR